MYVCAYNLYSRRRRYSTKTCFVGAIVLIIKMRIGPDETLLFVFLVLYLFLDVIRDVDICCRHTLSVRDTFLVLSITL